MTDTKPGEAANENTPAVIIEASYDDPIDHSLWIHKDLVKVREPYAVGPPRAEESFGDVDSWAGYVKRFGFGSTLLSWNGAGLRAVLDYHANDGLEGTPGRCQWNATLPFYKSPEWKAWAEFATGQAVPHKKAVERLEDLSEDITDPPAADLMNLLRNLRSTVNATAQTELLPDGTTRIGFSQDKAVKGISDMALPPEFTIAIPVLKGRDKRYKLAVKIRASVDDQAHLALRFSIPQAERALEMVYAELVAEAKALLGDGFSLLRAAG